MDNTFEKDLAGATYRSGDPIKHLKLRITLQRISPAALTFITNSPSTTGSGEGEQAAVTPASSEPRQTINEVGQMILEDEVLVCNWQQKFFSSREFEFYSTSPTSGTHQDYKYYGEIQKMKKLGGRKNNRIYTYVENDAFAPSGDDLVPMTTSSDETPTYVAEQMTQLRRRKPVLTGGNVLNTKIQQGQYTRGLNIVVKKPSEEFQNRNHVLNTPVHRMIVMADLSPESQLGIALYEKKLCEIEYDDIGVLRITPDFSRQKLPYRIDSGLSRDLWLYRIDTASTTMTKMEMQKENRRLKDMYDKHQTYLSTMVGSNFEEVKTNVLRLVINGEIVSAESFEYDNLHIEYFLDLAKNWTADQRALLSGCTNSCTTTLHDNIEKAYYSHPFSFDTYLSFSREDVEECSIEWPKFYLQVVSSDTWGRRRTEGYGCVTLPSSAGTHLRKATCWRPLGNGAGEIVHSELRRFFIGGSPELEDPTFVSVPNTFEGKRMSKYGLKTESTGTVMIRMNCIIQREAVTRDPDEVASHLRRKKQQTAFQMAKGRAANEAIHNVMESFLRARKRMQLARESVPDHIRKTAEERAQLATGDRSTHLSKVLAGETVWRKDEDDSNEVVETSA